MKINLNRRQFFKTGAAVGAAAIAIPYIIPSSALGKGGTVAPSERITLGAIGIGGRGSYVHKCMLQEKDVQCVAVSDLKTERLRAAKKRADQANGNTDCAVYKDFRDLLARDDIDAVLIATGPNWHATASMLAAKAGKDVYCEKPCTKNIAESLELAEVFERTGRVFQGGMQRRNISHFQFCIKLAHEGRLGRLTEVHAHPRGLSTEMSGWLPESPLPKDEQFDWHIYLGPAAMRPFNEKYLRGNKFEIGGGMVGGGILEWGSHCVDQCQWANSADDTAPVEYHPLQDDTITAFYANQVKLVIREYGWNNLGTCPVRFQGEAGWVETGDSGNINASSSELLDGRGRKNRGHAANNHVRDFFNCVKTRTLPKTNHFATCYSHIACSNINTALFLNRKLTFDPLKHEFINDDEANRFHSEARREPWRV